MSTSEQNQGSVKFFNSEKGFGFIIDDKTNKDIFVHANSLPSGLKLKENDRVSFDIEETKKGLNAVNVEFI